MSKKFVITIPDPGESGPDIIINGEGVSFNNCDELLKEIKELIEQDEGGEDNTRKERRVANRTRGLQNNRIG